MFLILDYVACEGGLRDSGKLLELLAEGVEDYRDPQYKTEEPIDKSRDKSTEDEPKKVTEEACAEVGIDSLSNGPHIEFSYLKALLSKGNTDNRYAPYDSRKEPERRADTSKGEEPQNIRYKFHLRPLHSISFEVFIHNDYITVDVHLSTEKAKIF